jgi:hypothetical protein
MKEINTEDPGVKSIKAYLAGRKSPDAVCMLNKNTHCIVCLGVGYERVEHGRKYSVGIKKVASAYGGQVFNLSPSLREIGIAFEELTEYSQAIWLLKEDLRGLPKNVKDALGLS